MELTECETDGTPISPLNTIVANKGWEVRIDKVLSETDQVVIYFLRWEENNQKLVLRNKQLVEKTINIPAIPAQKDGLGNITVAAVPAKTKNERVYFYLTIDDFKKGVSKKKSAIDVQFGTATIPIKIRPGNDEGIPFDFNGNFNAGVGLSIKLNSFHGINIYTGISITSVPVDEETSNGIVTSATNAGALTPTIGIIKEIGPVQVGGFIGFDYLSRELGQNWIYQGRRWFGVGVGVNIFDVSGGARGGNTQDP
nr:hypothetical protein [Allomuricauda sp.]